MPVYLVTLTAPNGNRVTRPIRAMSPAGAITEMEIDHGIDNVAAEGFTVEAQELDDPDREVEARLLRMEARNQARELWERSR
jgi:hypothetical protein